MALILKLTEYGHLLELFLLDIFAFVQNVGTFIFIWKVIINVSILFWTQARLWRCGKSKVRKEWVIFDE